ncbi:DMT family transporter [Asanoa sp. NPDC049518]|uniref:DMT family transporter n=1 Tax=unclassified Asanoa TaxID=2685164 RepID=UPI00343BE695
MRIAAAVATTVLLWASAFVAIRHLGADVRPGALALGRLLVAAVVLGALVAVRRPRWPDRAAWPRLVLCGVAWLGVYNVALNAAERRVDAGTAAMVVNLGPVLIAVLAGLFLGEGFPRTLLLGLGTAFAGTVLIGVAAAGDARADPWGVVLCLVAAVGYAVGVVAQKPLLAGSDPLAVTFLATVVGAAACLPFAGQLVADATEPATVGWLVYLGAGPTALAFTTWAYALAHTGAGKLGATTYLVPPLVVILAWALLGEVPAALALGGGLLCLAGVAATRAKSLTLTRRQGVSWEVERG